MVIVGMAHHLVPKMADVLYQLTYTRVVAECWSKELLRELALLDFLEDGRLVDLESWSRVIQQSSLSGRFCNPRFSMYVCQYWHLISDF